VPVGELLREYLDGQKAEDRRRHQERTELKDAVRAAVRESSDRTLEALQSFRDSVDVRFEDQGRKIESAKERAEEAFQLARGAHALHELAARNPRGAFRASHSAKEVVYELGDESPTGSHFIVSKEVLDKYSLEKDGERWRKVVGLIVKALGVALGAVASGWAVAHLLHP
jgi:hypothetical protein